MSKFKLAFGIHNHQPVGNFESVFEEAHRKAYDPFIKLLTEYDNISISLHQSGILWQWQEKNHPEYHKMIKKLVKKGRLELLTGGFYEPIFSSIPERDVLGQIKILNDYIEEHFGVITNGLWLTERIWEPHLPKVLSEAGVAFLPVDDTHFIYAGMEYDQLTGAFVTEHEGYSVRLLPIQKKLRYLIPFGTVDKVIDELKRQADINPSGMAIYADDGEKFGSWPETYMHCYENRWLPNFFDALAQNSDWLEVVPLYRANEEKAVGRAYLPTASYAEMLHWALPPKAFLEYENFENWLKEQGQYEKYSRFIRGSHWRNFLAKYDESNLMHKKMLSVSDKLNSLEKRTSNIDDKDITEAKKHLYAGQCNCPYWHGVFGGLYLPHIRQAIYSNLIDADRILNKAMNLNKIEIVLKDYDADGHDEIIVSGKALNAVVKPNRGGMLVDLSLNRHGFCLTDTLTRRREGYHIKLSRAVTTGNSSSTESIHEMVRAKEEGLEDYLIEDWYLKRCFIDHFFGSECDLEKFHMGKYDEEGDFVLETYGHRIDKDNSVLTLVRDGHVHRPEGEIPVRLEKTYRFENDHEKVAISYSLSTTGGRDIDVGFAVENNFNFQAGHAEDRYILIDNRKPSESFLDSVNCIKKAGSVALVDEYRDLAIALTSDKASEIWQLPIYTVSLSEGGFEKVYQGTTLINLYKIKISDKPYRIGLTLKAGTVSETIKSGVSPSKVKSI